MEKKIAKTTTATANENISNTNAASWVELWQSKQQYTLGIE